MSRAHRCAAVSVLLSVGLARAAANAAAWKTTAAITRNHGYLVYDTLYSIGEDLQPKPQMAAGHVWENDNLLLTVKIGRAHV